MNCFSTRNSKRKAKLSKLSEQQKPKAPDQCTSKTDLGLLENASSTGEKDVEDEKSIVKKDFMHGVDTNDNCSNEDVKETEQDKKKVQESECQGLESDSPGNKDNIQLKEDILTKKNMDIDVCMNEKLKKDDNVNGGEAIIDISQNVSNEDNEHLAEKGLEMDDIHLDDIDSEQKNSVLNEELTKDSSKVVFEIHEDMADEEETKDPENHDKEINMVEDINNSSLRSQKLDVRADSHELKGKLTSDKHSAEIDLDKTNTEAGDNDTHNVLQSKKMRLNIEEDFSPDDLDCYSEFVDRLSIRQAEGVVFDGVAADLDIVIQYMKKSHEKHLKQLLRHANWGVSDDIRQSLWFKLCNHLHRADDSDIFTEFAKDLFNPGDQSGVRVPGFVDQDHLNSYHLNTEGIHTAKQIVCVLEHSCPDIIYSPLLFSVLCLFLHYMDTSQCYNCLYALLRNKDGAYLSTTKVSYEASKLVIRDLAKKYTKSGYVHLVRNCSNIDQMFDSWIWWIFEELPFPHLVRVMDCYQYEGIKVLYRVALAILSLFTKANSKKTTSPKRDAVTGNGILMSLRQFCREMPVSADRLLKTGFHIRGLTRKEIRRLQVKHEMYINSTKNISNFNEVQNGGYLPMSRSFSGPIVLQSLGSNMLTTDMLYAILTWLPTRFAICTPELLYTSEEHGTSLVTLYERVEHHQPTIIVIKTTNDEVFGAFCSTYWRERKQKSQLLSYFGTGETFLFTLAPEKKKYEWVGLTEENIPNTASMFQAGDRTILTVGGGHGEAISLDENLLHCRSERCDTFNNEPLSKTEDFTCKVVEVYGFQ